MIEFFIHNRIIYIILININRLDFYILVYDLNESHIHPSTCSSALRASLKSGRFFYISGWMSCVSNKLFYSWHGESYIYNELV